jgi:hypothetical protein
MQSAGTARASGNMAWDAKGQGTSGGPCSVQVQTAVIRSRETGRAPVYQQHVTRTAAGCLSSMPCRCCYCHACKTRHAHSQKRYQPLHCGTLQRADTHLFQRSSTRPTHTAGSAATQDLPNCMAAGVLHKRFTSTLLHPLHLSSSSSRSITRACCFWSAAASQLS